MPYSDEQFSCHGYEHLYLVFLADYGLRIRETAEEAVLGKVKLICSSLLYTPTQFLALIEKEYHSNGRHTIQKNLNKTAPL